MIEGAHNKERSVLLLMNNLKENKMGTMPVGKLLFQMALPLALSMLVQALYNVVDSVFVAQISNSDNYALTAVSLASAQMRSTRRTRK